MPHDARLGYHVRWMKGIGRRFGVLVLTMVVCFVGAGGLGFGIRAGVNIFLLIFRIFRTPK